MIAFESDGVERYALHATAVDYARSRMHDAGMQDAIRGAAEAYAAFVKQYHNYAGFPIVEQEITNVLAMADAAFQQGAYEPVMHIADDLILGQGYLYVRSDWHAGQKLLEQGIEAARHSKNEQYEAMFMHELGIVRSGFGDLDGALDLYRQKPRRSRTGWATPRARPPRLHDGARGL